MNTSRNTITHSAFTLIEMSVVTCLLGVMVGGSLMLGTLRIEQKRIEATQSRLCIIESALQNYVQVNGRLPCPAAMTLSENHADFGQVANGVDCVGGSISPGWQDGKAVAGGVPFIALGLNAEMTRDAWERRLLYVVDARMTRDDAFIRNGSQSSCGSITVSDASGNPSVKNAVYLLMSHGIDGHGGYNRQAALVNAHVTHASTLANVAAKRNFRAHAYVDNPASPNERFDDILLYATRQQLRIPTDDRNSFFSLNNTSATKGWVYVPQTTLADGRVVPAFEVMQYEASNPHNNGVPISSAGNQPWGGMTYQQARAACQKLGAQGGTALNGTGTLMEYDIITESQWLAIAKHTSGDSRNWVDNCEGDSGLIAGHRDNSPAAALPAHTNDMLGYHASLNDSSESSVYNRSQRRTHFLPSGSIIWDLAGNLPEWSYCDLPAHCLSYGQTDRATYTLSTIPAAGNYGYSTLSLLAPAHGYDNAFHTGGLSIVHSSNRNGVLRGGGFDGGNNAGIYQASIGHSGTGGFRCAHHPTPEPFHPVNLDGLEIWYDASDIDGDGVEEGTAEAEVDSAAACSKTTTPVNNGCIRTWRNKAQNGKYHSRSKRLNGLPFGTENNVPTLKLSAINGKPAVNFDAGTAQWFDTHHGVNNAPVSDDGNGFDFANRGEFSIFIVGKAQNWDAVVAGTDDVALWWPHFVLFPFNINKLNSNKDYVFLVDNPMQGNDAGNDFCRANGTLLAPLDLLCLADPILKTNYACAQMGGISSSGLTNGGTHIATGMFKKGTDNGLSAYVNGVVTHAKDSSVHAQNDVIAGRQCLLSGLLRFLKIKLNIGMMRTDMNTRTVGDISEIIIFNRALSAKERAAIEGYLSEKYKIPLN